MSRHEPQPRPPDNAIIENVAELSVSHRDGDDQWMNASLGLTRALNQMYDEVKKARRAAHNVWSEFETAVEGVAEYSDDGILDAMWRKMVASSRKEESRRVGTVLRTIHHAVLFVLDQLRAAKNTAFPATPRRDSSAKYRLHYLITNIEQACVHIGEQALRAQGERMACKYLLVELKKVLGDMDSMFESSKDLLGIPVKDAQDAEGLAPFEAPVDGQEF
jgi:hypothetical protein